MQKKKRKRRSEINHPFEISEAKEKGSKNRRRARSRKPVSTPGDYYSSPEVCM